MTDNNQPDDFSHQETGEELPAPRGATSGLAAAWRTKPLFKLIVIMIVVAAVVAVISSFFSSGKDATMASRVMPPPDIHQPPGGAVSPYRKEQIDLANKTGSDKALQSGNSFLPTPQGPESDVDNAKDPLKELRAETEHLRQMVENQQKQPPAPPAVRVQTQQVQQFDNSLAQAMQHEMQQLVSSDWKVQGMHEVAVTKEKISTSANDAANANPTSSATTPIAAPKTLVAAGTVNYGQLLTEANSDVPGPILAQIVSGPFAGARAVGEFKAINDYLVMHFTLVNYKKKDYSIDAIALDPDTTLGGMATEVDERYFTRVILPAAAAFLQGMGQELASGNTSITSTGTTTIVTQSNQGFRYGAYQGLGAAANTAGDFFRDQANKTHELVRVAAGTPIGIFFTKTVTDQQGQETNGVQPIGAPLGVPNITNFGGQPMQQGANGASQGPYPAGSYNYGPPSGGIGGTSPYGGMSSYGAQPSGAYGGYPGGMSSYYGYGH